LSSDDLIIKLGIDVIVTFEHEGLSLVVEEQKFEFLHLSLHHVKFLSELMLLLSTGCDFIDLS